MPADYGTPEIFTDHLGGSAGSVAVTVPSGLAAGDGWLLLCFADSDPGTVTITASGFDPVSSILKNDNAAGYPLYIALAKVAGASEGSVNVDFSANCYSVQVISIPLTGIRAAGFIGNVTSVTSDTQDTATPSYSVPGVTVQADGSLVIDVVAWHSVGGWSWGLDTTPDGVTQIASRGDTYGGSQYPQWIVGAASADTGSYAPSGSWSFTNDVANHHKNAVKQTIEIRPASAGASATYAAWPNPRRNRPGRGPYSKGRYFRKAIFQPYVASTSIASVTWTASGGVTLSGASGVLRGAARAASGGLVLGGSALLSRGVVRTPSGGLVLGGTSPAARGAARSASGGLALGGTAPQNRGAVRDPSGGISLSGSAGYSSSSGAQSYSYVASGGLVLGGTADVEFVSLQAFSYTGVGGVEIAGTAPAYFTRIVLPTGGLSLGGSADFSSHSASRVVVASGGLRLRGAAVITTYGGLSVAGDYVIRARRRRHR